MLLASTVETIHMAKQRAYRRRRQRRQTPTMENPFCDLPYKWMEYYHLGGNWYEWRFRCSGPESPGYRLDRNGNKYDPTLSTELLEPL